MSEAQSADTDAPRCGLRCANPPCSMPRAGDLPGAGLAEHLYRAVERHEADLDRELGLAFVHLLAELHQRRPVGFGLDLRISHLRLAVCNLRGSAITMIDGDDFRNV